MIGGFLYTSGKVSGFVDKIKYIIKALIGGILTHLVERSVTCFVFLVRCKWLKGKNNAKDVADVKASTPTRIVTSATPSKIIANYGERQLANHQVRLSINERIDF